MAELTADATADDRLLSIDSEGIVGAYYDLDDEQIRLLGQNKPVNPVSGPWYWTTARAVAGSTAASHTSGATLTRYYPEAPGGSGSASAIAFTPNGSIAATDVQAAIQEVRDEATGGGIPQGGPLTEDLISGGFGLVGADGGAAVEGESVTIAGGSGDAGNWLAAAIILEGGIDGEARVRIAAGAIAGPTATAPARPADLNLIASNGGAGASGGAGVNLYAGDDDGGNGGAELGVYGGEDANGANGSFWAGAGIANMPGGSIEIGGGDGDDGADAKAQIMFGGGSGAGVAGSITLTVVGASGGNIVLVGIPTADPTVAGAIWNDAGTLKVSAG